MLSGRTLAAQALPAPTLTPGATTSLPSFEAAAIKPSRPDEDRGLSWSPAHFTARHCSVFDLIRFAYHVNTDDQLLAAPDWTKKEFFDIEAKATDQEIASMQQLDIMRTMEQQRLMLQSLLRDRFQLKISKRTQEIRVFALRVGKGNPKLKQVGTAPAGNLTGPAPPPPPGSGKSASGIRKTGPNQFTATAIAMNSFTSFLSNQSEVGGRLVVDQTGLSGLYDFVLDGISLPQAPGSDASMHSPDDTSASIFNRVAGATRIVPGAHQGSRRGYRR
jgi:uncharacterized protein (TIGR03435 family)